MSINVAYNQKVLQINRELVERNTSRPYLCIYTDTLMEASRKLSNSAFKVYLYLVSNRDKYTFALSPTAIKDETGVCLDTVRKAIRELEVLNYIVHIRENEYAFYENRKFDKKEIFKNINFFSSSSFY